MRYRPAGRRLRRCTWSGHAIEQQLRPAGSRPASTVLARTVSRSSEGLTGRGPHRATSSGHATSSGGQVLQLVKVSATGQRSAVSSSRRRPHGSRSARRHHLRPAHRSPSQARPPVSAQVLQLVKVPATSHRSTGQPPSLRQRHQFRFCHRPPASSAGHAAGHRPSVRPEAHARPPASSSGHRPAVSSSGHRPASTVLALRPAGSGQPGSGQHRFQRSGLAAGEGPARSASTVLALRTPASSSGVALGQAMPSSSSSGQRAASVPAVRPCSWSGSGQRSAVSGQHRPCSRSGHRPAAQAMPPASAQACRW